MYNLLRPESALRTSFKVEEGDIILLGTDGLFDNMKDEMILKHLAKLQAWATNITSFFKVFFPSIAWSKDIHNIEL